MSKVVMRFILAVGLVLALFFSLSGTKLIASVAPGRNAAPARITSAPFTASLSAVPGELQINLTFSVNDTGTPPISQFKLAKGVASTTIQNLTLADYTNPPSGVEIISLFATTTSYSDQAVSEGVHYYYKLLACDSAVSPNCALSRVIEGNAGSVPIAFAFGTQEMVFDTPAQACQTITGFDVPDVPARAVRRGDGSIYLVSGNSRGNYFEEGPDFNHLQRNCSTPAPLDSNFNSNPAQFDYQRWVLGTYRDPNSANPNRIYALIHMEYHDTVHVPPCASVNSPCLYNSITYAYSDDGGHSYIQPPAPARFLAAVPYPWDPNLSNNPGVNPPRPFGYFAGTSIFEGSDGNYYAFTSVVYDPLHAAASFRTCLMRTNNLGDPSSWRFWDGTGFNHQTRNPYGPNTVSYATAIADPSTYFCTLVDSNIQDTDISITWNTYLHKYMMLGMKGDPLQGIPCGFYYTLSNDLIHWSLPQIFKEVNLTWCDNTAPRDQYPTIIDHSDTSVNFENADNQFYLYFTHYTSNMDRDLVREPVTITHW